MTKGCITGDSEFLIFENGEYNDPFDDVGRTCEEIEEEFLTVYNALFQAISEVVRLKESGTLIAADVSMSKWVDPTRVIPLVITRTDESFKRLLPSIVTVLARHPNHAAILFPEHGKIVILGDGSVLYSETTPIEILNDLGIEALR